MDFKMKGIGVLLALMVLGSGNVGCGLILGAGVVGGAAGTAVYLNGEMSLASSVSMEKAWKASEDVIADRGMRVTEKSIDNMDRNRVIKGKTKEKEDFEIRLEAKDQDVTVIKTRVGLLGNEEKARNLLEAIEKKIKG